MTARASVPAPSAAHALDDRDRVEALERSVGIVASRLRFGLAAIKSSPDDFVVEELDERGGLNTVDGYAGPASPAQGQRRGHYVEYTLVKRNLTTPEAINRVATALRIPAAKFTYAGLKDAKAVTAQAVRVDRRLVASIEDRVLDDVALLSPRPAGEPLAVGDLAGNRFHLRVVPRDAVDHADVRAIFGEACIPNYFDFQRFGRRVNLHHIGRLLVVGDTQEAARRFVVEATPSEGRRLREIRARASDEWPNLDGVESVLQRGPRHLLALERQLVSAVRRRGWSAVWYLPMVGPFAVRAWVSYVFNLGVSAGACDAADGLPLFDASDDVARFYAEICPGEPVGRAPVKEAIRSLRSARRPTSVAVTSLAITRDGPTHEWVFTLPKGAYATTVVRQAFLVDAGPTGAR